MKKILSFLKLFSLILFFEYFLFSNFAFAYLDPGMITAFFQLLIAGIVGALVTIKFWWFSLKNFLSKIFKKKNNQNNQNDGTNNPINKS